MTDWIELNRANWDDRAPVHAASAEYGLDRFVGDPQHLSDVVRFDLPRLGDLTGLVGVHLSPSLGRHVAFATRRDRLRGPSATSAPTRCRCPASAPG